MGFSDSLLRIWVVLCYIFWPTELVFMVLGLIDLKLDWHIGAQFYLCTVYLFLLALGMVISRELCAVRNLSISFFSISSIIIFWEKKCNK